jgi:hypothetical protein
MICIKYPHIRAFSKGISRPRTQNNLDVVAFSRVFRAAAGISYLTNGMIGLQYWIYILESFFQAHTPRYSLWSKYRMNG